MKDEEHRKYSIDMFNRYLDMSFKRETISLNLEELRLLSTEEGGPYTYILRLNPDRQIKPRIWSIPNQNDAYKILYIGGSKSYQKIVRPKSLIVSCQSAVKIFLREGYAINDQKFGHSVAGAITTGLLEYGFSLDDCVLDVVNGENVANELEFLIGYEEIYFHLPPWNSDRKGESCFRK